MPHTNSREQSLGNGAGRRAFRVRTAALPFGIAARLLATPVPGSAQGSATGTLAGIVVDGSGAVLPGVTVGRPGP